MMFAVNYYAVILAAILGFFVGSPWYSKWMFGEIFKREAKLTEAECKKPAPTAYIYSLLYSLLSVLVFAWVLGVHPRFFYAIGMGLVIGIAWVASALGINYQFSSKCNNWKLYLIDSGYHVVRFFIYGIVLGLWR